MSEIKNEIENKLNINLFKKNTEKYFSENMFSKLTEKEAKDKLSQFLVAILMLMKSMSISIEKNINADIYVCGVQSGFMSGLSPLYCLFTKEQIKAYLEESEKKEKPIFTLQDYALFEKIINIYTQNLE